ncbi:MAG: hypothetical protein M1575_01345 [Patescibacteria group bacterium]|nr:hypothetical protein [Patescibacteria group bacterium]MCL5095361.1 hypothetical protein [Patescibacteria group bacterium]
MSFKEIDRPPIIGELNIQHFVVDENGHLFLKRIPKENPALLERIRAEYVGTHFFALGGSFRRRTSKEQALFAKQAASNKLRVLTPKYIDGEVTYYPFMEKAQTLDRFFQKPFLQPEIVVGQLLEDLRAAHTLGVNYGDRWHPNILVVPNIGIMHIDFDIEISGSCAKEFETAQVVYYTVLSGKNKVISLISDFLAYRLWCNSKLVAHFLEAKIAFFQGTDYGGIEDSIRAIIQKTL